MKKYLPLLLLMVAGATMAQLPPVNPLVNPNGTNANVWIDTNGGACTRSATPVAYVDGNACASMQAAQTIAQANDTIVMKTGTYGGQSLSSSEKTTGQTHFYCETYRQCFISDFNISIGNVTVSGVQTTGGFNTRPDIGIQYTSARPVTIDGMSVRTVTIGNAPSVRVSNLTLMNMEFGNGTPGTSFEEDAVHVNAGTDGISFLNDYFHDWFSTAANDSNFHNDFIQLFMGSGVLATNVVLRGNIFNNGPFGGGILQVGGGSMSNFTVENNFLGSMKSCGNTIAFGQGSTSGFLRIRNNVFSGNCSYALANDVSNSGAYTLEGSGNVYLTSQIACSVNQNPTGGFNVFIPSGGATCGTNVKRCTPTFLNGPPSASNNYDIRLSPSDTCAQDAGNPSSFPTTDFYGTARPQGIAPDAGAFEIPVGAQANLWIDTTGGTCTRTASPSSYVDSAACGSFTQAYNAALAGDVIYVKGGTYGAQTIPSRSLPGVYTTISKAPGETVTTGGINVNTNWIIVNGFNLGNNGISIGNSFSGSTCTRTHVSITNNVMIGTSAGIGGNCIDTLLIDGNEIGGTDVCLGSPPSEDSIQFSGNGSTGTWGELTPTNVMISHNYIHDMAAVAGGQSCGGSQPPHADGVQMAGCNTCTFDGNRFDNVDSSYVIIYQSLASNASTSIRNIIFRNNSAGRVKEPGHGFSVGGASCTGSTSNFLVENNTFWTGNTHDINCTSSSSIDGIARNNLYVVNDGGFSCSGGGGGGNNLTRDRNVYAVGMAGCGTNKKSCAPSFIDSTHTQGDVRLNPNDTCAKDYVPNVSGTFPATDYLATVRPQGTAVDAGAYEVPANTISPTLNLLTGMVATFTARGSLNPTANVGTSMIPTFTTVGVPTGTVTFTYHAVR